MTDKNLHRRIEARVARLYDDAQVFSETRRLYAVLRLQRSSQHLVRCTGNSYKRCELYLYFNYTPSDSFRIKRLVFSFLRRLST